MNLSLIFGTDVTVETLCEMNDAGFEFVIEAGVITEVIC